MGEVMQAIHCSIVAGFGEMQRVQVVAMTQAELMIIGEANEIRALQGQQNENDPIDAQERDTVLAVASVATH